MSHVYDLKKRWLTSVDFADVSMQPRCNNIQSHMPEERARSSKHHQIDPVSSPLNIMAVALKSKCNNSGDTELGVE